MSLSCLIIVYLQPSIWKGGGGVKFAGDDMNKQSTIEKGDEFSDRVIAILGAAGFHGITGENRDNFKKTDAAAVFSKSTLDGDLQFRFEMKNYEGTVDKAECERFVNEYGKLIQRGDIDRAWLISKGKISPDGRALIQAYRKDGLQCFTVEEFYRHILNLDMYLYDIEEEYSKSGLNEFYIKPKTDDDDDLEQVVRNWISDGNYDKPMAIIGSYGQGKSTFAKHLAAVLATEAREDRSRRIPILITLGDLVEEQSLDGLVGSVLASKHKSSGYHFSLFRELNKAGAFLIIYDGLDEMKHGMVPRTFQRNLDNLLELDEGNSKILLLGRDSVAYTDDEFRAIIDGYQSTKSGQIVPNLKRKQIDRLSIRGFTVDEAKHFIQRYFSHLARLENLEEDWIENRISELTSDKFEKLSVRPVHAQMLCRIATDKSQSLADMSLFELYDKFIHYLIERETDKVGRYPEFDADIRRNFNSAVAWWLWERGQSTTTTLADIPHQICKEVVNGIDHSFSTEALRRELAQGCLVHKAKTTVYFGHRSIQEFLVAEYLFDTNLLFNQETLSPDIGRVYPYMSEVIIEFVFNWMDRASNNKDRIRSWVKALEGWRPKHLSLNNVDFLLLMVEVAKNLDPSVHKQFLNSPWGIVLTAIKAGTGSLDKHNVEIVKWLRITIRRNKSDFVLQCVCIQILSILYQNTRKREVSECILDVLLDPYNVRDVMEDARSSSQDVFVNRNNDKYPLIWLFMKCVQVKKEINSESYLILKLDKLDGLVQQETGIGLEADSKDTENPNISFRDLYSRMSKNGVQELELETIRKFLNDPSTRRKIRPIEVEVIKKVASKSFRRG